MSDAQSSHKAIPYYTTDDESKWCGHLWRQRSQIGGIWGVAWAVYPPYGEDQPAASGWRPDQAQAESAMSEALERLQGAK